MTAFDSIDYKTVIETSYSASLLVYIYDKNTHMLHGHFYFTGENINDIPVDVMYYIDKYNNML
eukprot:NODE_9460_length_368_cov_100.344828_g8556_i0.p1 GENE.NODE_9460_length_368_cov_100.344828_g8556_i0~~NODE_9460_length_368_cov_100.344828_g8556_i0.p1  ORF type:complete len:63 (-),score=1.05 NODE_9460_length_368_cov_100.344828_g8556_i0:58-246(-)